MLCDWADIIDWIIFFAVQIASFMIEKVFLVTNYQALCSCLALPCLIFFFLLSDTAVLGNLQKSSVSFWQSN